MTLVYRLLFVGAPMVGKGTYCTRIARALRCLHISSGDLLRSIDKATALGQRVHATISRGDLVDDSLMMQLVSAQATRATNTATPQEQRYAGYLLDGFPRTLAQAQLAWQSGALQVDHVVNLTQPRSVLEAKVMWRRVCPDCQAVYNIREIHVDDVDMPALLPRHEGVCDRCGSRRPLQARTDDAPEVFRKRLDAYEATAGPLLSFYGEKGILHNFAVRGGAEAYAPQLLSFIRSFYDPAEGR